MSNSSQGVTIVASFRVRPEHRDEILATVRACVHASRQEETNRSYRCRRDRSDPLRFVFIEQWASIEAIAEHERTPHFRTMKAALDGGADGPLDITLLEDVDGLS